MTPAETEQAKAILGAVRAYVDKYAAKVDARCHEHENVLVQLGHQITQSEADGTRALEEVVRLLALRSPAILLQRIGELEARLAVLERKG